MLLGVSWTYSGFASRYEKFCEQGLPTRNHCTNRMAILIEAPHRRAPVRFEAGEPAEDYLPGAANGREGADWRDRGCLPVPPKSMPAGGILLVYNWKGAQ